MLKSDIRLTVLLTLMPIGVLAQVTIEHAFALFMGLSLRIAYNYHRNIITFKDSLIRVVCAIGVSYAILNFQKYFFTGTSPIFAIFFSSMISLEIVIMSIEITKTSFKEWFRGKIKQFIGTNND